MADTTPGRAITGAAAIIVAIGTIGGAYAWVDSTFVQASDLQDLKNQTSEQYLDLSARILSREIDALSDRIRDKKYDQALMVRDGGVRDRLLDEHIHDMQKRLDALNRERDRVTRKQNGAR